jgi:hypothetical protein
MLGKWILIVQFLKEENSLIELALPRSMRWFDFRTLVEVKDSKTNIKYDRGRTAVYISGR